MLNLELTLDEVRYLNQALHDGVRQAEALIESMEDKRAVVSQAQKLYVLLTVVEKVESLPGLVRSGLTHYMGAI